MGSLDIPFYDVLVAGAGLSGVCSLHHIRQRFPDWRVACIEAGPSVGGTWWFNRYPGARVDSESIAYAYSFDKSVINEWNWSETFASQPEIMRYIDFVVDKNDLKKYIQFNKRIRSAVWQGDSDSTDSKYNRTWLLTDDQGEVYRTRFLVTCIGFLSAPTAPAIAGLDTFAGDAFHTSRWPAHLADLGKDGGALAGKRVGVIGTGASGIQTITALSKLPGIQSVHVFQRTANWSAPLRNEPITPERMAEIRKSYDDIFALCETTPGGFIHAPDKRKTADVSDEERNALYEQRYSEPGFAKWIALFSDTYSDRTANDLYSKFMADKIRARVNDPEVAESLIPKNHGIGTRRLPLESGYFEAYNQPHVHLVDLKKTPLQHATPRGLVTSDGTEYPLDVLIYATGFSAITGAFADIDWRGENGRALLGYSEDAGADAGAKKTEEAAWVDHRPRTFLGTTVPGMPNLLMVMGPHQPFGNGTRNIEHSVNLVCDILQHCKDNGHTYIEPTETAVDAWTQHVTDCSKGSLINEIDSWMTGVNRNVKGRTVRTVARYAGSAVDFRERCEAVRSAGWEGLQFQ
ncbi:hypothetical protein SCUCBS95973_007836 [Sporothrix curviconia]|uniref:Cyclohexanone monooxygenase n=1 Tax=Sporothrix curviconia TaxID=1260050 RepID=A0ABP0CJF7_9PEZI